MKHKGRKKEGSSRFLFFCAFLWLIFLCRQPLAEQSREQPQRRAKGAKKKSPAKSFYAAFVPFCG
jgi:hypothetical protein